MCAECNAKTYPKFKLWPHLTGWPKYLVEAFYWKVSISNEDCIQTLNNFLLHKVAVLFKARILLRRAVKFSS